MAADKDCDGVCVFHENYETKVNTVYDWHLGEIERQKTMSKKIDNMTAWFRRLALTISAGLALQILIPLIRAAIK